MERIEDKYILEVCANSIQSALTANESGANRIELCSAISEGGITPSIAMIKMVRELINIDINVLIRPREGNFVYDKFEFEIIKNDIVECGRIGCQGVVIGVLDKSGNIDKDKNKELVYLAKNTGLETTFHRAIDRTKNIFKSIEEIIELGFDRILTSGGYPNAYDGRKEINKINKRFGNKIKIMAGAGITPDNIIEIVQETQIREIHGTFSSPFYNKVYNNTKMKDDHTLLRTDIEKIKTIRKLLDKL